VYRARLEAGGSVENRTGFQGQGIACISKEGAIVFSTKGDCCMIDPRSFSGSGPAEGGLERRRRSWPVPEAISRGPSEDKDTREGRGGRRQRNRGKNNPRPKTTGAIRPRAEAVDAGASVDASARRGTEFGFYAIVRRSRASERAEGNTRKPGDER